MLDKLLHEINQAQKVQTIPENWPRVDDAIRIICRRYYTNKLSHTALYSERARWMLCFTLRLLYRMPIFHTPLFFYCKMINIFL